MAWCFSLNVHHDPVFPFLFCICCYWFPWSLDWWMSDSLISQSATLHSNLCRGKAGKAEDCGEWWGFPEWSPVAGVMSSYYWSNILSHCTNINPFRCFPLPALVSRVSPPPSTSVCPPLFLLTVQPGEQCSDCRVISPAGFELAQWKKCGHSIILWRTSVLTCASVEQARIELASIQLFD